jgi:hypothetical protein
MPAGGAFPGKTGVDTAVREWFDKLHEVQTGPLSGETFSFPNIKSAADSHGTRYLAVKTGIK